MKNNWNWTKNEDKSSRSLSSPSTFLSPLTSFYSDMDRMFDQAFRNFGLTSLTGGNPIPGMPSMPGMAFNPRVDISSTDKEYTIEMEIPGLSENDIRLNVNR